MIYLYNYPTIRPLSIHPLTNPFIHYLSKYTPIYSITHPSIHSSIIHILPIYPFILASIYSSSHKTTNPHTYICIYYIHIIILTRWLCTRHICALSSLLRSFLLLLGEIGTGIMAAFLLYQFNARLTRTSNKPLLSLACGLEASRQYFLSIIWSCAWK